MICTREHDIWFTGICYFCPVSRMLKVCLDSENFYGRASLKAKG